MAIGNQTPASVASDYATLAFLVQQKLSQVSTLTLARVIDCTNDGGIEPVGTLTVQPLVNMMSGDRVAFPHKPLYKVLYVRVQGGNSAVILDPKPGDIGLVGFCSRDISSVKAAKDIANPGSLRQFSMSDGVYLLTCLGGVAPTQYVVLNDEGVSIVSPTKITLQAPAIEIDGGGNTTIDGKPFLPHTHDGVQAGGDISGPVT